MTLDLFQFNYSLTHTHLTLQIHLILGIGGFNNNFEPYEKGVMGDVAASANDPIFINHHTMVDCILEEWLQQNNRTAIYPNPTDPGTINRGHRRDDYIVPFIPLFTHEMMFKTADNFGYSCNLDLSGPTEPDSAKPATALVLYVLVLAIVGIITLILWSLCNFCTFFGCLYTYWITECIFLRTCPILVLQCRFHLLLIATCWIWNA